MIGIKSDDASEQSPWRAVTWCSAGILRGEGLQTGLLKVTEFCRDCAQSWRIKIVAKAVLCSNENWLVHHCF